MVVFGIAHLYIGFANIGPLATLDGVAISQNPKQGELLASYRLNATIVKGSTGGSVVLKAAYRAAERLTNERTGDVYDYRRKRGVVHAEVMLPAGADDNLAKREHLWNAVEAFELGKRKDAQLAREVTLSLPHELSDKERLQRMRRLRPIDFPVATVRSGACRWSCEHVGESRTSSL